MITLLLVVEKLLSETRGPSIFHLENHGHIKDKDDQDPSINLKPLPRVGYVEMDDEHKIIDGSLLKLITYFFYFFLSHIQCILFFFFFLSLK